jgi:hypothetical protein
MPEKKIVVLNSPEFDSGSLFNSKEIKIQETIATLKDKKEVKTKKRGRKPGKNKMYFTPDTEKSITKYCNEENSVIKNNIYNKEIKFAFEKLAENIINTFSFSYIPEVYTDIKTEVVSHMLLNIDKFDATKGKAFSYFSIMAKNYLIISNNQYYSDLKSNYSIQSDENSEYYEFDIVDDSHDKNVKSHEVKEFIKLMVEYWEINVPLVFKKKRDIDIAYAVVELFRNVGALEFFNKKALYLLIREMTGYKTQYITRVINKMQSRYNEIKLSYYNNGIITEHSFFEKK